MKRNIVNMEQQIMENEKVECPSHYLWLKVKCGVEPIDIIKHYSYLRGTALAYLMRAGFKEEQGYTKEQKELEDLLKAKKYIEWEIEELKKKLLNVEYDESKTEVYTGKL